MRDRLDYSEFVNQAPATPGQVNVHHCKRGKNNDRMYITRNSDGSIVAYCHHCNKSGWFADGKSGPKSFGERYSKLAKLHRNPDVVFSSFEQRQTNWPTVAQEHLELYRNKGYIWPNNEYIAFNDRDSRLYYKVHESMYVGRQMDPNKRANGSPKWLRLGKFKPVSVVDLRGIIRVCLVEDIISANCIAEQLMFCSGVVPLLGTSVNDTLIKHLARGDQTVIYIWLDDDNAQVRLTQRKIFKRLSVEAPGKRVINLSQKGLEPKHLSRKELERECHRLIREYES